MKRTKNKKQLHTISKRYVNKIFIANYGLNLDYQEQRYTKIN